MSRIGYEFEEDKPLAQRIRKALEAIRSLLEDKLEQLCDDLDLIFDLFDML